MHSKANRSISLGRVGWAEAHLMYKIPRLIIQHQDPKKPGELRSPIRIWPLLQHLIWEGREGWMCLYCNQGDCYQERPRTCENILDWVQLPPGCLPLTFWGHVSGYLPGHLYCRSGWCVTTTRGDDRCSKNLINDSCLFSISVDCLYERNNVIRPILAVTLWHEITHDRTLLAGLLLCNQVVQSFVKSTFETVIFPLVITQVQATLGLNFCVTDRVLRLTDPITWSFQLCFDLSLQSLEGRHLMSSQDKFDLYSTIHTKGNSRCVTGKQQ